MHYSGKIYKSSLQLILLLSLALSGCATKVPLKPYVKPNAVRPGKMAILPFENLSNSGEAAKVVDNLFHVTFIQYGTMKIADPDQVREALRKLKAGSFLKANQIKSLKRLLGVDYIMAGKVLEFVSGGSPSVSLSVRVLDTETGNLVWAINLSKKGKDTGDFLGGGKIRSVHMLAGMAIDEIAQSFNSAVATGSRKESGFSEITVAKTEESETGGRKPDARPAEAPEAQTVPTPVAPVAEAPGTPTVPTSAAPVAEAPSTPTAPTPAAPVAEEPVSAAEKKEASEQPATPVIGQAPQPAVSGGIVAVPPQKSADLTSQSITTQALVPAIPKTVLPEAPKEDVPLQQKGASIPSTVDGEKKAADRAKATPQPAEKSAEVAIKAIPALPEAVPQPVQPLIAKESAVTAQKPSDSPAPAIVEKKESPAVKSPTPLVTTVKEINVIADGFEIVTAGTVAGYKTFALTKPPRLVIDVVGAKSVMAGKIQLRGFGIKGARIGTYHGKLRIVLDGLREISPYRIEKTERGLKIIMRNALPRGTKEGRGKDKMDKTAAPLPVKARMPELAANQDICPEKPAEGKTAEAASPLELTIHFDINRSGIASGHYAQAEKIAAFMKDNPDAVLSIEGHADYTGSPWYNLALSQRRAESVGGFLEKNFSVPSSRIAMKGFGCTRPLADNILPEGRGKNRRTIVHVLTPDRKTDGYEVAVKR